MVQRAPQPRDQGNHLRHHLNETRWTGWTFFQVKPTGSVEGSLQPGDLGLPDGTEGHRGLLPQLPELGEIAQGSEVPAAKAKAYAPLPNSREPNVRSQPKGPGLVLAGDGQGGTVLGYAASSSAQHQPLVIVRRGRGSAVDRAQPVLADLRRRAEGHGHLPPAEEELSGSWSEVSDET